MKPSFKGMFFERIMEVLWEEYKRIGGELVSIQTFEKAGELNEKLKSDLETIDFMNKILFSKELPEKEGLLLEFRKIGMAMQIIKGKDQDMQKAYEEAVKEQKEESK